MQAHTTLGNAIETPATLLLARVGTGEAYDLIAAAATLAGAGTSEFSPAPFLVPLADDAKGSGKDDDEDEDEPFGDDDADDDEDDVEDEDEFEDDEDEFFGEDDDDDEFGGDEDDDDEDEDF
ncbi:MAG TPA: hypothetical protein PKE29_03345 [Phycisphaerales bacterium]|nr:hypothetical protein [Phycisphaerales bacterium]